MSWQKLEIANSDVIKALEKTNQSATAVINILHSILNIVKVILNTIKKFLLVLPDAEAAALKAAIVAVRALLKDLTDSTGCYFLAVPVRIAHPAFPEDKIIYAIEPERFHLPETMIPLATGGRGGNYGFLKTIAESVEDRNDLARPQFDDDTHFAGVVVVAGAPTYLDVLPVIEKLRKLFGKRGGRDFADPEFPLPRNLRAEIVPVPLTGKTRPNMIPSGGGRGICGVRLSWDEQERQTVSRAFDPPVVTTITHGVILRAEAPLPIDASYKSLKANKNIKRLKEFEFDGWINDFFDGTAELGKTYYYALGYRVEIVQGEGSLTKIEPTYWSTTSIRIPERLDVLFGKGIPPDWLLLPSPLALIPGIDRIIGEINLFLDTLEKRLDDAAEKYKKYIEALSEEIDDYSRKADEFLRLVKELIDLLTFPPRVYVGAYTFSGKGTTQHVINKIGTALNDTNDPNRPPFDRGDEAVAGFVLLVGSATAGKLEAFKNVTNLLFGGDQAAAAIKAAIASVVAETEAIEREIKLLENLDEDTSPPPVTQETKMLAIGPDLEPALEQNEGKE